jgi:hypothetical protein
MKKIFLLLMMVASVASAHPQMSDAKIRAMIIGPWTLDGAVDGRTVEFKSDGMVDYGKGIGSVKWAIKNGDYTETDGTRTYWFKILYLTKTEFLTKGVTIHGKGYFFFWRNPEDVPDGVPDSFYWSKED